MAARMEASYHQLAKVAVRCLRQPHVSSRFREAQIRANPMTAQNEIRQCRSFHQSTRRLAASSSHAVSDAISFDDMLEDAADEEIDLAELSSTGYAELEQHQEMRELMRLAAWEMPLLSRLAKPFEPPNIAASPLRWRYTTYFGDPHPASSKVTVEFRVSDLKLNPKAALKLKKLAGVRYNPGTKSVRLSSDSFDTQARNKRFLAGTIDNLVREAKDGSTDSFEDIALDSRHFKQKPQHTFPHSWKMTKERRTELEAKRLRTAVYHANRIEEHPDTAGLEVIEAELEQQPQRVVEPVTVARVRGSKRS